jgi:hypothetical protein
MFKELGCTQKINLSFLQKRAKPINPLNKIMNFPYLWAMVREQDMNSVHNLGHIDIREILPSKRTKSLQENDLGLFDIFLSH